MTQWVAEQNDEQDQKGTLEVGKFADLVILDKNPLQVDPRTIKDIKVVETIKEGVTIFPAPSSFDDVTQALGEQPSRKRDRTKETRTPRPTHREWSVGSSRSTARRIEKRVRRGCCFISRCSPPFPQNQR